MSSAHTLRGQSRGYSALALALALTASALPASAEQAPAAPASAPRHQLSVYWGVGVQAYLSDARTQGGLGGGLGLRDTVDERWLLQADLHYLTALGHVGALRLGAGVQGRLGPWAPAALLTLSSIFGEQLSFITPDHRRPLLTPSLSLGVVLAPLRFGVQGTQVSLFELGLGAGSDWPGLGLNYQLRLLEVAVPL